MVEFQRDEDVVDEGHEAESLRSTDGADGRNAGRGAGPAPMDIDGRGERAAASALGSGGNRQGGAATTAPAGRDFSRQTSSRIHHVHFHESGCPPFAAPGTQTADQALPPTDDQATVAPTGNSPASGDAGHGGPFGSSASQHPASSGQQRMEPPDAAPRRVPSAEQLALLQRVDSHQTIKHGARAASAGTLPEELSATEQGSVVGVKRSNSGVVSPNKEGEKLPLKCATWPFLPIRHRCGADATAAPGMRPILLGQRLLADLLGNIVCRGLPTADPRRACLPPRRKLFEEGLPANLAAALTATAKAPVHALTNGVHAAVASIASAAALPFVSGAAGPVPPSVADRAHVPLQPTRGRHWLARMNVLPMVCSSG